MTDQERIESIIRNIAASFTGDQSTRDWTEETPSGLMLLPMPA